MKTPSYRPGDFVVFRAHKHTTRPGRRAQNVRPDRSGDAYSYDIEKFWVVQSVLPNGRLQLRTRRGKLRECYASDPQLRRASFWERLWYRKRFPQPEVDMPTDHQHPVSD